MRHSQRIKDLVERLQAIRDSVGWDCDIGVEIHRNMSPGDSIVLAKEIEHIRPYFFEDPIAPDSVLSFGEVSEKSNIPMAAGERNLNIWEFREYIEKAGVHYIRPDVGLAGGFTQLKKICALAEAFQIPVIPHAGQVHNFHISMSSINAPIVEYFPFWPVEIGNELFWYIFDGEPKAKNGFIELDESKPGLGISLSDQYLDSFSIEI